MAKASIHIRASALTIEQLERLEAATGMTRTELISVAIDRMADAEQIGAKMKKAKVVDVRVEGGIQRTREMRLVAGEKGSGRIIARIEYWPDSGRSCEEADDYIGRAARRNGYEIVPVGE